MEQAERDLTRRTQQLDTHNGKVTIAKNNEDDAHKKMTEAESRHADKEKIEEGSRQTANEAKRALEQAKYWSGHTEILEKDHYWDGEFGSIHQAADTILKDKSDEYDAAKSKNDKHLDDVREALQAVKEARRVKKQASDVRMNLEAKTPLLQDNFVKAETKKNDATYIHAVAEQIHKVYHK